MRSATCAQSLGSLSFHGRDGGKVQLELELKSGTTRSRVISLSGIIPVLFFRTE